MAKVCFVTPRGVYTTDNCSNEKAKQMFDAASDLVAGIVFNSEGGRVFLPVDILKQSAILIELDKE